MKIKLLFLDDRDIFIADRIKEKKESLLEYLRGNVENKDVIEVPDTDKIFNKIINNITAILSNTGKEDIAVEQIVHFCQIPLSKNRDYKPCKYNREFPDKGTLEKLDSNGVCYPIKFLEAMKPSNDNDFLLVFCDYSWDHAPAEYLKMPEQILEKIKDTEKCGLIFYSCIQPKEAYEFAVRMYNENENAKCKLIPGVWGITRYLCEEERYMNNAMLDLCDSLKKLKKEIQTDETGRL